MPAVLLVRGGATRVLGFGGVDAVLIDVARTGLGDDVSADARDLGLEAQALDGEAAVDVGAHGAIEGDLRPAVVQTLGRGRHG